MSSAFLIQIVLGLIILFIGCLTLFIYSKYFTFPFVTMTWVAIASAIVLMIFKIWFVYILDITRLHLAPFRFLSISLSSKVIGSIFACFAVVVLGWGLDGFLFAQAIVMVVLFPFACFLIKKDITLKVSEVWLRETLRFGYPFIFAGIAFWLLGSVDRWMLAAFTSLDEVGNYSVAYRFSSVILFISTAFGMAWGPIAIKLKTDNPNIYKNIYADLLLVFLFVILFISGTISLFSGEIINLLMNESYRDSAIALIFLSFGVGLYGTQQITAIGISIEKKTFLFSRIAWISLILNITINYLLIPAYGATGASLATLICYIFITFSYMYYSEKLHGIFFKKLKIFILLLLGFGLLFCSIELCSEILEFPGFVMKLTLLLLFGILGFFVIRNHFRFDSRGDLS
ncbi:MAG: oligosaccharide flippase family protein [Opitutae bacterium]|nr:oligosaccharide flippase family protein [Opitutae bacterium]